MFFLGVTHLPARITSVQHFDAEKQFCACWLLLQLQEYRSVDWEVHMRFKELQHIAILRAVENTTFHYSVLLFL
jgi:hypothetical protein